MSVRPPAAVLHGTPRIFTVESPADGHGGGDARLVADLLAAVAQARPVNHIRAGCMATMTALAGEISMQTGQTVRLDSLMPVSG